MRRASFHWALFGLYQVCRIRPVFNAIHCLSDLIPLFSVYFTWDSRTKWARLFFSQLQGSLVACFWCPRKTFRLPHRTIWFQGLIDHRSLADPSCHYSCGKWQPWLRIGSPSMRLLGQHGNHFWCVLIQASLFGIVAAPLELSLGPWSIFDPLFGYRVVLVYLLLLVREENRAICEERLVMQFACYFL